MMNQEEKSLEQKNNLAAFFLIFRIKIFLLRINLFPYL